MERLYADVDIKCRTPEITEVSMCRETPMIIRGGPEYEAVITVRFNGPIPDAINRIIESGELK